MRVKTAAAALGIAGILAIAALAASPAFAAKPALHAAEPVVAVHAATSAPVLGQRCILGKLTGYAPVGYESLPDCIGARWNTSVTTFTGAQKWSGDYPLPTGWLDTEYSTVQIVTYSG